MNKISIITVTYNAELYLEKTILSVIKQTYKNYEYIIIDGASKDNTLNIIKKYSSNITKWISEKDNGLYDAMNKGIDIASGDWIFFINAGDYFVSNRILENLFINQNYNNTDILYGNAIENKNGIKSKKEGKFISLNRPPEYRHGASFVRSSIHKKHKFDLSKTKLLGYSLDYDCIYTLYKNKYIFKYINSEIIEYDADGISNHPIQSKYYRCLIENNCSKSFLFYFHFFKSIISAVLKRISFFKRLLLSLYYLFTDYILNHIFAHIPFWIIRKYYLIICGAKIKGKTQIDMGCTILDPFRLKIGKHSHINRNCLLDARGCLTIGEKVSISQHVKIVTGSHDPQSPEFTYLRKPVIIDSYVWIGINATILGEIKIGEGAVICAGSVVTKDVEPYTIVAGIPAKKIGTRNRNLIYTPLKDIYYWPMFI